MNWQTFSHPAFVFRITAGLLVGGIIFAMLICIMGALPPGIRVARRPIASALREL